MNSPENEIRPSRATATRPMPEQSAPTHRKTAGLLAAAFLAGVVGTAAVTFKRGPAPAAIPTKAPAKPDAETQPQSALIRLAPAAARNAGVKTQPAALAPLVETMTVPGAVEANPSRQARITPPTPGKLARILVKQGDTVRAGQPLAVLDSYDVAQAHAALRDAELGVGQAAAAAQTAQAQIGQSRARVDNARTALARQRQFAQVGAFSQAPLLAAQAEASQARTEQAQAQTELGTRTAAAQRAERLMGDELISRSELEQAQADRQQNQARVEQARTRVALAGQALAREKKVYGGDLLSKQAIESAEADVRAAQAEWQTDQRQAQAARAALQGARGRASAAHANLAALEGGGHTEGAAAGLVTLRAPLAGVVTERAATPGETVERSTALMTISNTDAVLVQANVPERDAARVRVGQKVQVTVPAYPGRMFAGVVQTLGSRVDEKTRSLPVRCLIPNPGGKLKPEMFARVSLAIGKGGSAVYIPSAAVDEDGDRRFVYVARDGGYEKRAVQTGHATAAATRIVSGLRAGERVAVKGVFVLKSESKKDELKGDED